MLAALGNNQLPSLTALELAHCSLSDDVGEDMREMLAGNTSLTALSLSWNKLRVGGLVAVAEGVCASASLASVDLSWNGFGDMAPLGVLCDALHTRNTTLTCLDLGHNRVTGQGCTVLAQALQANTSLTKLVLDGNPVGAAGAKQLVTLTLPDDDEVEGEAADLYGCGAGGAMEGDDAEAEGSLLGLVWQADDLEVGGMGPDRQPVVPVCMWVYVYLSIDRSIYLSIYVHLHTYTCVYVSRAWGRTGSPRERGSSLSMYIYLHIHVYIYQGHGAGPAARGREARARGPQSGVGAPRRRGRRQADRYDGYLFRGGVGRLWRARGPHAPSLCHCWTGERPRHVPHATRLIARPVC